MPSCPDCGREALLPAGVARVGPEEKLQALARGAIPPLDETLDEPPLVGRVARRVAADDDEGAAGIEPVAA